MSLLDPDEVQAAGIGTELDTDALQDAIDEEEAWLARRIGPLTGERTQRFPLAYLQPRSGAIYLRRPAVADDIEVLQDGVDVSALIEVRGDGRQVAYLPNGSHFVGVIEVTWTPDDELEVKRALKELIGLTLGTQASGGLQSEIMGSYSWTRAQGSASRRRRAIVRDLLAPPEASSVRLLSSVRHGIAGALGR